MVVIPAPTAVVGALPDGTILMNAVPMPALSSVHMPTVTVRGPSSGLAGPLETVANVPVNAPGSSRTPMLGTVPFTDTTFELTTTTGKSSLGRRSRALTDNAPGSGMVVVIGADHGLRVLLAGPAVPPVAVPTRSGSVPGCTCCICLLPVLFIIM